MCALPLITIHNQSISLEESFAYLQLFGRLQPFVQEVVRCYTLYQEVQRRDDLKITDVELAQAILDFRLRQGLTDASRFSQWLSDQNLQYALFEQQVLLGLKQEKLKACLAESSIESFFEEHRHLFDQVDLYYMVVVDEKLAQQLYEQVAAGNSFEQVPQAFPLDSEQKVVVKREINRRGQLREEIRLAIATAIPSELVGPIPIGQRWCVFRVEQILPAQFDDAVRLELQETLFNHWLTEKQQQLLMPADENAVEAQTEVIQESDSSVPKELEMVAPVAQEN
jgi:parvulin-like peptidyl-prolyl isomerase